MVAADNVGGAPRLREALADRGESGRAAELHFVPILTSGYM
jgi:hypothetical protein